MTQEVVANPLVKPYVVAVANQKGGVGKTTTTVNLAASLSTFGLPVIVIDMDPQFNATDALGVRVPKTQNTIYEVLHPEFEHRVPLAKALMGTDHGVALVPGTRAMATIEKDGNGSGGEASLAAAIADAPAPALYLIDCPPNLGRLTKMSLVAAGMVQAGGEAFVPVSPGPFEIKGMFELLMTITALKKNGQARFLSLGSVVVSNYDGRTQVDRDSKIQLRNRFQPEYLGEIRHTVKVSEAAARGLPVGLYAPESTAAEDYREIAREFALRKGLVTAA